ncbi:MAG: DoxX family protein [Prevotella sp.]|nr:DoxX family protein [Bacteroides sp.]MCM1365876.1 DoxX family protein [Prevotella sp.]
MDKKQKGDFDKATRWYFHLITWIVRLSVGGVFVFSGFVKCIDPWGTLYKIHDYIGVIDFNVPDDIIVVAAFVLGIIEFLVGTLLILGMFRKFSSWLVCLIMLFMLPLTLWIALSNPVADCGCFGDAFIISNWATFWKNIALSAGAVWLLLYNKRTRSLISPYIQWIALVVAGVYAAFICFAGYSYQPLIDFRPYKIGTNLYKSDENNDNPNFVFIYEKDGIKKEFTEDSIPEDGEGWNFVDRKEIHVSSDSGRKDKDITIWAENEELDVTDDVLGIGGKQLIMLIPNLSDTSIASSYTINSLNSWAKNRDIDFFALVAGSHTNIEEWKDLSMSDYPIYRTEDTTIKEIARGNPALVYLEEGNIKWKRTLRSIRVEDFLNADTPDDPMEFAHDDLTFLLNITYLYFAIFAVLIFLSFSPSMAKMIRIK